MTKEEFLKGKSFRLNRSYIGKDITFSTDKDNSYLSEEFRGKDNRVLFSKHIMNIDKIGRKIITAYCFILDSRIIKKIRFEDMIEFPEQDNI